MRNMSKLVIIGLFLSIMVISTQVCADIASLEANFVAGESDIVGHLNRDRTTLANSTNNILGSCVGSVQTTGQVKADTIGEENMCDGANPRIFWDEMMFNEKLDDYQGIIGVCAPSEAPGYLFTTSANLTGSASPGCGYTRGYRCETTSSTAKTFTAQRWTTAFLCSDCSLDYVELPIGTDILPSQYPSDCQPIARVSTDATTINHVLDIRKTSFTLNSYDSVYDVDPESHLKDLLHANYSSYHAGALCKYNNASQLTVTAGAAMIMGEARDRVEFVSDASWPVATDDDQDGIDAGTRTDGIYYTYLVADEDNTQTYRVVFSHNPDAPAGKDDYMRICEFNNTNGIISRDSVYNYYYNEEVFVRGGGEISAWLQYNQKTDVIGHSYGIDSVTDDATGKFTITFETDFTTENFSVVGTGIEGATSSEVFCGDDNLTTRSASYVQMSCEIHDGANVDAARVNIIATGVQV